MLRSLAELLVSFDPCTWPPSRPVPVDYVPLTIRDAATEEFDQASAVMQAAYQEYKPDPLPPAWAGTWDAYWREIGAVGSRADEAQLILATIGEHIAGAVTFYPDASRSKSVDWPPGWAAIRLLAVRPDCRCRGIGRALAQECLRRARRHGALAVGLHTDSRMPIAARLYSQLGFRRAPDLDFRPLPEAGITVLGWTLDLAPAPGEPGREDE